MANIVVTSDADFIYISYNDIPHYSRDRKIRRSSIVEVQCLDCNQGIEMDLSARDSVNLKTGEVDSVNAITDLDTDAKLYDAIKDLM